MSLPNPPLPDSENFYIDLMAMYEAWRISIESKAAGEHSHGAGGIVISIVANEAALGIGTLDGESKITADTGHRWIWDVSTETWIDINVVPPGIPVGGSILWDGDDPPEGFLERDGAEISRTIYAGLFAVRGVRDGAGDGVDTFNLADNRGDFLRIWDHGAGNDPDAATRTDRGDGSTGDVNSSKQLDEIKSHSHPGYQQTGTYQTDNTGGHYASRGAAGTGTTGGSESRPRNAYIMLCIKY